VDPDVLLATLRSLLRARRAEEALRDADARFQEIFSQVNAPIAVLDEQLQIRESNPAFARLLSDADANGSLFAMMGSNKEFVLDLQDALARQERWQGVLAITGRQGLRTTQWRLTPDRRTGHGLVVVEDVTEHHVRALEQRAELETATSELAHQIAERTRTEGELLQAQKMDSLGQLTGGIAHDFNNLLTTIISGLDMIELAVASSRLEKVPQYSSIAAASAQRAAALTQRMLAFARKQPLDSRPFDLVARTRSLEDLLRRSIGENIELEFELGEEPLVAIADVNQFENVVLNLVINARDALAGRGLIRLRAEASEIQRENELTPGRYVSLKVIDNGPGIPLDLLDKVFEPFFTTKPQGEGTGLGLSMTYGFARQSGGVARIASEPGEGTEIELLLPAGESVHADRGIDQVTPPRGQSERILLVDDTDSVRMMVGEMLSEAGYQVTLAADARQALRQLRQDPAFDLLLSDVGLPGMDGRELADAAREINPVLPVLFITGYTERAAVRETFLGTGMSLLPKPFSLLELMAAVRAAL